jgi:2'-hydroxyisoflavone reductase
VGKRILVLGGTNFIGPCVIDAARARGHTLTLFHRGKTGGERFPEVETLLGDRNGALEALRGRRWDAVIDMCGYFPRQVAASAGLLASAVEHYVFVSSISAYADELPAHSDESAALATMPDPSVEDMKYYGALKALCEQAAEHALPGRVTHVRAGLVIGPGDPTDRFTYWPARYARGGEVLAPGDGSDPAQLIDARDLGAWLVRVVDDGTVGIYNAVGPAQAITMKDVLAACASAAATGATTTWVDAAFLAERGIHAWSDLPVWPGEEARNFATVSVQRAIARGLTFRPLVESARDTLAWWQAQHRSLKAGLAPDQEAALLAGWKERRS